jgi:bacterioferritin (cytochrome b1)
MANGGLKKTLKKLVEGEHMAANALAVASSKAKEMDLQKFLADLSAKHETNALTAGGKLKDLGGKYPTPGLRDSLKKGWESVATSKTTTDALKTLQKKEREAIQTYKELLKKAKDDNTTNMLARYLADTSENVAALSDKLREQEKKNKKKGGKFLGIPRIIWLAALGAGAVVFIRSRMQSGPSSPTPPSGSSGSPAGDSNNS